MVNHKINLDAIKQEKNRLQQIEKQEQVEPASQEVLNTLREYQRLGNIDVINKVQQIVDDYVASHKDFYTLTGQEKEKANTDLRRQINAGASLNSKIARKTVDNELKAPYGIFYPLLNANYSDIIIHKNGWQLSRGQKFYNQTVPDDLLELHHKQLFHLIDELSHSNTERFDPSHAIVDDEITTEGIGIIRYNLMHQSLMGREHIPLAIFRKQIVNESVKNSNYFEELGLSENQLKEIKKSSLKGMTIICGETGSGKTTLMEHMINYKIGGKRNIVVIEDTQELNVNVPLKFATTPQTPIRTIFKATLRENPSGIIIGETRNDEIIDILTASLATQFCMTTIHATTLGKAIQYMTQIALQRANTSVDNMHNLIRESADTIVLMEEHKVKHMWKNTYDRNKSVFDIFEEIK